MTPPTLYRCSRCGQSIVVTVRARVTCMRCHRVMKPESTNLSEDDKAVTYSRLKP